MRSAKRTDILTKHFQLAASALGRRSWAHDTTRYTLTSLYERVETPLLANLDALVIAGRATFDALLADMPEDDMSPVERACVALALIALGAQDEVVGRLLSGNPEASEPAARALVLAGDAGFDAWLTQELERGAETTKRKALLSVALHRGIDAGELLGSMQSADDEEVALAAAAAAYGDPRLHGPLIEYLLAHPSPAVREAAMQTGLIHGSGRAFRRCLEAAAEPEVPQPRAMLLAALADGATATGILCEHLGRPTHSDAALHALGYTGQRQVTDLLLGYLDHGRPTTAKLAGEALSTLTGLDLLDGSYALTEEEPDADDELPDILMPRGLSVMPLPNRDAVVSWWRETGGAACAQSPCFLGQPLNFSAALTHMTEAPLRRRHALAFWLALQSKGAVRVNTHRLAPFQRAQLARAATLPVSARVRSFLRLA